MTTDYGDKGFYGGVGRWIRWRGVGSGFVVGERESTLPEKAFLGHYAAIITLISRNRETRKLLAY